MNLLQKLLLIASCCTAFAGCTGIGYGDRQVGPVDQAALDADSARVQKSERKERAEYRKERRQDMMDEADAIRRANGNKPPVYIIH